MKVRILSYNIHKGIGGIDRKYIPERIIETIAHYDPDIALLQEVDDGVPRSRHERQVDILGDALGYEYRAFQSNVALRTGTYGNAILSRFPYDELHNIDLSIPLKKRRRALVIRTHLHGHGHERSLIIANTHLGLASIERGVQLRRLLRHHSMDHLRHKTPVIVGGDFNDIWGQLGRRILDPRGFTAAFRKTKTFPARYPVRPLDRMFYRGELELESSFAGHTSLAKEASDHLPIIADFRVAHL